MTSDSAVIRAKENLIGLLTELPQGSRLPGERILAEDFGVCRVTLRRAVEDLISDGKLERRARSGTFVKRPMIPSELRLKSFTEEIRERGQVPSTQIIGFRKTKATKSVARALAIREREDIYVITRLRLADEMPIAIETLKIACRLIPTLSSNELVGSLYDLFFEKYGIRISNAKAGITAHNPTEKNKELLQITGSTPCLLIKMVDKDQSGRPVMTAECIYRSDLFELEIQLSANLSGVRQPETKKVS